MKTSRKSAIKINSQTISSVLKKSARMLVSEGRSIFVAKDIVEEMLNEQSHLSLAFVAVLLRSYPDFERDIRAYINNEPLDMGPVLEFIDEAIDALRKEGGCNIPLWNVVENAMKQVCDDESFNLFQ